MPFVQAVASSLAFASVFIGGFGGTFNDGGEGGIRTPDTLSGTLAFEASAFNHSATSPDLFAAMRKTIINEWLAGGYLVHAAPENRDSDENSSL